MRRPSSPLAFAFALMGLAAVAFAARAAATTAADVPPDEIQEDWQVVVGVPDPDGHGPQISTSMSPVEDRSTPFFVFNLNHRDRPSFSAGGLQAQVWSGEEVIDLATKGQEECSAEGETITWTQSIKLSSDRVSFAVNSGRSTTWGEFGQGQQLDLKGVGYPTDLVSLSRYSPDRSVAGSGVGWERNRVASMTLLRVRYYAAGKLLSTDSTARPVDLTK